MQLILNTDTDIGISKMSTIQQESLDEKFINRSLIENVCSDIANITNGNDDSVKNNDDENVCENIVSTNDDKCASENYDSDNQSSKSQIDNHESIICDTDGTKDLENGEAETIESPQGNDISEVHSDTNNRIETDISLEAIDSQIVEEKVKTIEELENVTKESDISNGNGIEMDKNKDHQNHAEDHEKEICEVEETNTDQSQVSHMLQNEIVDDLNNHTREESVELKDKLEEPNLESDLNDLEIEKVNDLEDKVTERGQEENEKEEEPKQQLQIEGTKDTEGELCQNYSKTKEQDQDISPDEISLIDDAAVANSTNDDDKRPENDPEFDSDRNCDLDVTSTEQNGDAQKLEQLGNIKEVTEEHMECDLENKKNNVDKEDIPIQEDECAHSQEENIQTLNSTSENDVINIESGEVLDKTEEDIENLEAIDEVQFVQKESHTESSNCESNIDEQTNETHISNKDLNLQDSANEEVKMDFIDKSTAESLEDKQEISTKTVLTPQMVTEEVDLSNESDEKSIEDPIIEKDKTTATEKPVADKKKLTHISKLSNTLDILSDDEEETSKEIPQKIVPVAVEKQCIDLVDDDDIMVVDDESNVNNNKGQVESVKESTDVPLDAICIEDPKDKEVQSETPTNKQDKPETEVSTTVDIEKTETEPEKPVPVEAEVQKKPLLSLNFLDTCKKKLADMTRDELEEFCILKIVQSVAERSNLSETNTQLKSLARNVEEFRKKATVLTKQNRDLQVVLKSVQEELKKKSNTPITPLKITRSVGMQVLMNDKVPVRKKQVQGQNTQQNLANRLVKGQQNPRLQKANSTPQIPVPRLVPATNCNINNIKVQPPNLNMAGKAQVTGFLANIQMQTVPNGLPVPSPPQKPEKRPHSRTQGNNSVTVDLTDDEPPAKVAQRNVTPPVRLVPPQSLLAPHRQPFGTSVNSPRKVYIPISGSQSQGVRAGQAIMLRSIAPQNTRQRCPSPVVGKSNTSPNSIRMQKISNRHPAPLPDSMKQYQPPNWKNLPPAPELKLSKVDNGIVISWKIDGYQEDDYEEIASYQLYAYQETNAPPSTNLWKKIGDVKALPLPMACTLTQFMAGYKYYFAVRAVDVRSRLGPFSLPGSILLLNKM